MRKYERYQLVAEYGEVSEGYESYREAFRVYQNCREPKTLFGVNFTGEYNVIFSK